MKDQANEFILKTLSLPSEVLAVIERLFEVVKPEALYSEPVEAGDHMLITASELIVTMGAGYGGGGGGSPEDDDEENDENDTSFGAGGGGGGGGFSMGRPVAVISIGPKGVRVDPIVDPTKIAIAFFTTFAAMAMTLSKIRRLKG